MHRILVLALILVAAPARADRTLTVDAHLGVGGISQIYDNPNNMPVDWSSNSVGANGLVSIGFGMFATEQLAIEARFASAGYMLTELDLESRATFVGLAAQYWLLPMLWVGGGVGVMIDDPGDTHDERFHDGRAPALDVRIGAAIVRSTHAALDISIEYTPGLYTKRFDGDRTSILGLLALEIGVQFM